ncbi:hypothetical protein LX32DRAFT_9173 [Colletotrichum zoysiae]|uniref:Uncharacterized protein n=1 Tax=Colletotrichum zoysiae TaxID=1216348 RepID=A0AAD9HF34_9PEZI|nr:hypothetical protein LX32DRAFT_9173 [Colletotrichum zoysiae]
MTVAAIPRTAPRRDTTSCAPLAANCMLCTMCDVYRPSSRLHHHHRPPPPPPCPRRQSVFEALAPLPTARLIVLLPIMCSYLGTPGCAELERSALFLPSHPLQKPQAFWFPPADPLSSSSPTAVGLATNYGAGSIDGLWSR